jgi:hypothetical protein
MCASGELSLVRQLMTIGEEISGSSRIRYSTSSRPSRRTEEGTRAMPTPALWPNISRDRRSLYTIAPLYPRHFYTNRSISSVVTKGLSPTLQRRYGGGCKVGTGRQQSGSNQRSSFQFGLTSTRSAWPSRAQRLRQAAEKPRICRLLMLWTAPAPARKCQRCGRC